MRRALVVLALLAAAGWQAVLAQTVVVGVGGQLTGELYGRVRVPVYADLRGASGVKLGSYTLRLAWDPNVLNYQSVDEGAFGLPSLGTDSVYEGVLRVGGLSAAGVDGLVDLFAVNLAVSSDQSTPVTLTVTEVVAAGTFADLTGQVTVLSGLYCPASGRWGDLDRDGQANSRDALAMLSAIVGLPIDSATFDLSLGDVDADGAVNSRDALITLSYAVGLDVPGQRVLVYAPGAACGGGTTLGVAILPDTVDVAVAQQVRLLLAGSVDGVPAGTSVEWAVTDPEIATVSVGGVLAGRSAGSTTVRASVGPGIVASVPVIVRARRGTWYVDGPRATLAAIQLGTRKYPFSTPQYAFPILQEGDTIRFAPGVHDYLGGDNCTGYYGGGDTPPVGDVPAPAPPPDQCSRYAYVSRGVVMIGDTLADGTRPVVRGNPDAYYALQTDLGAWADVRNLTFRNFGDPVYVYGPTRFLRFTNTRIEIPGSGSGIYVYGDGLDSLVLRDVEIDGDTTSSSDVLDVSYVTLVRIDGLTASAQYGMYFAYLDSLDIRNSDVRTRYRPLYLSGYNYTTQSSGRTYLADNRFEVSADEVAYLYDVYHVQSERNVYVGGDQASYNIVTVDGVSSPPVPGSRLEMSYDSVIRRLDPNNYSYSPISAWDLDTIRLDSVIQVQPDSGFVNYGSVMYGNTIEILRSVFENQGSTYPLYIGGRYLTVSGSRFTGCRIDCGTRYGVELESYTDSIARVEVSNNTFFQLYRPIVVYSGASAHRVVVTGNTIDSVTHGMILYGDSITVTDNVLTRVSGYGIYASSSSANPSPYGLLQRNRVFAIGTADALQWYNGDLVSEGNYYGGMQRGAYVYNSSGVTRTTSLVGDTLVADSALASRAAYLTGPWSASIRRSRILGGEYGLLGDGATTLTLDSNVVTGSAVYGAQLGGTAAYSVTGRWNNFTSNAGSGLYVYGGASASVTEGRFVGNAAFGVVAGAGTTVDATNNWWGSASGPGPGTGADSASGTVTTTGFLTSDPLGVSVPATPPLALAVPDLWRTSLRSRRPSVETAVAPEPVPTREQILQRHAARHQVVRAQVERHRAEMARLRPERR